MSQQQQQNSWVKQLKLNLKSILNLKNDSSKKFYVQCISGEQIKNCENLKFDTKKQEYSWGKGNKIDFKQADQTIYFVLKDYKDKQMIAIGAISVFNIYMMIQNNEIISKNTVKYHCELHNLDPNIDLLELVLEVNLIIEPKMEKEPQIQMQTYKNLQDQRVILTIVNKSNHIKDKGELLLNPIVYAKYDSYVHNTGPAIIQGQIIEWDEEIVFKINTQKEPQQNQLQNMIILRIQDFDSKNNNHFSYIGFIPLMVRNGNQIYQKKIKLFSNDYNQSNIIISTQFFPKNTQIKEADFPETGKHKYQYQNQDLYEGLWENYKKNGLGQQFYAGKALLYQGNWLNNEYNGQGKYIFENGSTYDGYFIKDKRVGYGKINYLYGEKEELIYEGAFGKNNCNGVGILKFPKNKQYFVIFKNGYFIKFLENLEEAEKILPPTFSIKVLYNDKQENIEKNIIIKVQSTQNIEDVKKLIKLQIKDIEIDDILYLQDEILENNKQLSQYLIQNGYQLEIKKKNNQQELNKSSNKTIIKSQKSNNIVSDTETVISFRKSKLAASVTESDILAKQQEIQKRNQFNKTGEKDVEKVLNLMRRQKSDMEQVDTIKEELQQNNEAIQKQQELLKQQEIQRELQQKQFEIRAEQEQLALLNKQNQEKEIFEQKNYLQEEKLKWEQEKKMFKIKKLQEEKELQNLEQKKQMLLQDLQYQEQQQSKNSFYSKKNQYQRPRNYSHNHYNKKIQLTDDQLNQLIQSKLNNNPLNQYSNTADIYQTQQMMPFNNPPTNPNLNSKLPIQNTMPFLNPQQNTILPIQNTNNYQYLLEQQKYAQEIDNFVTAMQETEKQRLKSLKLQQNLLKKEKQLIQKFDQKFQQLDQEREQFLQEYHQRNLELDQQLLQQNKFKNINALPQIQIKSRRSQSLGHNNFNNSNQFQSKNQFQQKIKHPYEDDLKYKNQMFQKNQFTDIKNKGYDISQDSFYNPKLNSKNNKFDGYNSSNNNNNYKYPTNNHHLYQKPYSGGKINNRRINQIDNQYLSNNNLRNLQDSQNSLIDNNNSNLNNSNNNNIYKSSNIQSYYPTKY